MNRRQFLASIAAVPALSAVKGRAAEPIEATVELTCDDLPQMMAQCFGSHAYVINGRAHGENTFVPMPQFVGSETGPEITHYPHNPTVYDAAPPNTYIAPRNVVGAVNANAAVIAIDQLTASIDALAKAIR